MRFATSEEPLIDEYATDYLCNSAAKVNIRPDPFLLSTPRRKRSTLGLFDFEGPEYNYYDNSLLKSFHDMEDQQLLSPAPMDAPVSPSAFRDPLPRFLFRSLESPPESPVKRGSLAPFTFPAQQSTPERSVDVSSIDVSQTASKSSQRRAQHGCNCRNTKCLRLNCKCFKTLGYCGEGCACLDCLNREEFSTVRDFVVAKTREINQVAFQPKAIAVDPQTDTVVNSRGCSCRTGCQKNYCECYRLGTGCSPICRCVSCLNAKVVLDKQQVVECMHVARRTKHKIVIEDCVDNLQKMNDQSELTLSSELTEEDRLKVRGFSVAFRRYKRVKTSTKDSKVTSVKNSPQPL